jgi:DNA-binding transcriptional MerR regulator
LSRNKVEFAIHELAKRADVSVRTIRYYIDEGLLPAPDTRGRYSVYTEEYLDRLELIRRLKDSFLPLKEIRATIISLSWEEVKTSLADLRQRNAEQQQSNDSKGEPKSMHQIEDDRTSALEYIADLLNSEPVKRPIPPRIIDPTETVWLKRPPDLDLASWQRITLSDGLELHIRQPYRPEDQPKIEHLLRLARKLFSL